MWIYILHVLILIWRVLSLVSSLPGCTNYTLHNESWRHTVRGSRAALSNNTSCDARNLRNGWHRFSGKAGTKLFNTCPNRANICGTQSPGWVFGSHPSTPGALTNATLHFYSYYCADDSGKVYIRNCGKYFVYKFTSIPYWSCNYGLCTI